MKAEFYGVRGSIPSLSSLNRRYGGNTSCLAVWSRAGNLLVIDGGTGIRQLGLTLGQSGRCSVFITHRHWDHVMGLPFFAPLYREGWEVDICVPPGCGDVLSRVLDGVGFPVPVDALHARVRVIETAFDRRLRLEGMDVTIFSVPHPGGCAGLQIEADGKRLALSADCELSENPSPEQQADMARLLDNADCAVVDGQNTLEEMTSRLGWGHSCPEFWLEPAQRAGVRHLVFTHHDPTRTDDALDSALQTLQAQRTPFRTDMAFEGLCLHFDDLPNKAPRANADKINN